MPLFVGKAGRKERMKKYVINAYLIFWFMVLGICGGASMIFHAPPVVMRILSNVCAWSPTFVLLLMWKKLRPEQKRLDFIAAQFSGKLKWSLLILLILIIAGGSCLAVLCLSLIQGRTFSSYFSMGGYSFVASFLFSMLSGPTGEELGWRGYLREELAEKYSFFKAALVQGAVWTFWHTVLWFVDSDFSGIQLIPYILSNLIVMTSLVFVMNTILQKYKNLIYSIAIHFAFNFIYCFLQVDIWFYVFLTIVYLLIGAGFYMWHRWSEGMAHYKCKR